MVVASLSRADLQATLDFLSVAAGADGPDPFPRDSLIALGDLIAADLTEYFEMRRADRSAIAWTMSRDEPDPPEVLEAEKLGLLADNPLGAFTWRPADGPLRLSTVIGRRQLRRLPFHDAYLRPMRIRDQLRVWLWDSSESVACVTLYRGNGVFSDRDVAVLAILQGHLIARRQAAMARPQPPTGRVDGELTIREAEVLTWIAAGRRTEEIADTLFISPGTVRKHLEHAYAKLGVRDRGEATADLFGLRPSSG